MESSLTKENSIHPETNLGVVTLNIADLEKQLNFYQLVLGLELIEVENGEAVLGTSSRALLRLVENQSYRRFRQVTGLYHFALVYPDRRRLALAIARLYSMKVPNAPTDHIMTKATYFDDPEGNGIELYAESPEDGEWFMEEDNFAARRSDGSLSNGREALDLEELFSHIEEGDEIERPAPAGVRMGHIHLHVRDLDEAVGFYHGVLGFDLMGKTSAFQMAFVSAGGYHHHIGLNTWKGTGAPPPPEDALGLKSFEVRLPGEAALAQVVEHVRSAGLDFEQTQGGILLLDPSQNLIILKADKMGKV